MCSAIALPCKPQIRSVTRIINLTSSDWHPVEAGDHLGRRLCEPSVLEVSVVRSLRKHLRCWHAAGCQGCRIERSRADKKGETSRLGSGVMRHTAAWWNCEPVSDWSTGLLARCISARPLLNLYGSAAPVVAFAIICDLNYIWSCSDGYCRTVVIQKALMVRKAEVCAMRIQLRHYGRTIWKLPCSDNKCLKSLELCSCMTYKKRKQRSRPKPAKNGTSRPDGSVMEICIFQ